MNTLPDTLAARHLPGTHAPVRVSSLLSTAPGPWPTHDSAASRTIDTLAAESLPPHTLMQRAGLSVARLAMALAPNARRIDVLAGHGNNGGDGFEAALHLHRAGRSVVLHTFGRDTAWPPDAAASRRQAQLAGVHIVEGLDAVALSHSDLVIDALLGRGLTRPASGELGEAIRMLRGHAAPVLAVDLPSGLPGDTGALQVDAPCVQARWTLALLTMAPGLFTANGRDQAGEVWWDDLGVDLLHTRTPSPSAWLHCAAGIDRVWPIRRHAQHKGSFGDVRVVGGAPSMAGAVLLAARTALSVGAGRVHAHLLDPAAPHLDPVHPELMLTGTPEASQLRAATVVAGCGGGQAIRAVLPEILQHAARLVLDADALNAIADDADLLDSLRHRRDRHQPTVLTPHPLEAARLLDCSATAIQSDRLRAARTLADRTGAVVVLKGSGSLTASPDSIPWINTSGNAALATPGSGDVLAGWIGGLWSELAGAAADHGPSTAWSAAELASRHAVHQHGLRAERHSPTGRTLVASRLVPSTVDS
ncbi:NAD(P)H-hydrate dehydratase [Sphaerotilus sp.]|uniref:NAD(P)H-hydrate dehydratase n=1 Tax=Sphaerotilus sp. TaxID=2093942 RepID=UPI002ACDC1E4|nr:NAD(P)H-hydrate dehydratase [Sphaerotilus sp.]MDZ7858504.1 NAD(P)H-hydrate dehydratase [Sphaerotilus sp.]